METTQHHRKKSRLKEGVKKILEYGKVVYSTLSVFFFLASYQICNYFYPLNTEEHITNWWYLKADLYVLVICLCYLAAITKDPENKRAKFIGDFMLSFGVGFAISNTIDRWVFDSRFFTWSSYYPLIFIAIVSYYNVKRITKQAEQFAEHLTND